MISPQDYLKNLIYTHINEVFMNLDQNSVKVDIWNGQVTLSNMVREIVTLILSK